MRSRTRQATIRAGGWTRRNSVGSRSRVCSASSHMEPGELATIRSRSSRYHASHRVQPVPANRAGTSRSLVASSSGCNLDAAAALDQLRGLLDVPELGFVVEGDRAALRIGVWFVHDEQRRDPRNRHPEMGVRSAGPHLAQGAAVPPLISMGT